MQLSGVSRREAMSELEKLRAAPKRWQLAVDAPYPSLKSSKAVEKSQEINASANLIVLVRNLAQLDAALKCGVTTIYCEFEDPKKYREAVTQFHTAYGCQINPSRLPSTTISGRVLVITLNNP